MTDDSLARLPVPVFLAQSRFSQDIQRASGTVELEAAFKRYLRAYQHWRLRLSPRQREDLITILPGDPSVAEIAVGCLGVAKGLGAVGDFAALASEVYELGRDMYSEGWVGLATWSGEKAVDVASEALWKRMASRVERAWRRAGYAATRNQRRWRRVVERFASGAVKAAGTVSAPVMCMASVMAPSQVASDHVQTFLVHQHLLELHAKRQFELMAKGLGYGSVDAMLEAGRLGRRPGEGLMGHPSGATGRSGPSLSPMR